MSGDQLTCTATKESLVGLSVQCEREFGHGGAHTATVDDPEIDADFTYVISWWPKEKKP
jgi:hypothetical protein